MYEKQASKQVLPKTPVDQKSTHKDQHKKIHPQEWGAKMKK